MMTFHDFHVFFSVVMNLKRGYLLCLIMYIGAGEVFGSVQPYPEGVIIGPARTLFLNYYDELRRPGNLELKYDSVTKRAIPVRLELKHPRFFYLLDNQSLVMHQFFIFPGDSIRISADATGAMSISGKNTKEYELLLDFFRRGVSLIMGSEMKYDMVTQFSQRLDQIKKNSNIRKNLLTEYRPYVRAEYYQVMSEVIDLVFLDWQLLAYGKCSPIENYNLKNHENNRAIFFDARNIVNRIDSSRFEVLSCWLPVVLENYCRFLTSQQQVWNSQLERFEAMFDSARSTFTGKTRDLALTQLMMDRINGESVSSEYIMTYKNICEQNDYVNAVDKMRVDKSKVATDRELASTMLVDRNGFEVSWHDLLAARKGKIVYLDFWASWCAGCKINTKHLGSVKGKYPKVMVVFVSIDRDKERWKKAVIDWGIENMGDHYWLNPDSKLAGILAKPSIPRHTLIDKQGDVVSIDADGPSSIKLIQSLEHLLDR